jgi:hypothetical protein
VNEVRICIVNSNLSKGMNTSYICPFMFDVPSNDTGLVLDRIYAK